MRAKLLGLGGAMLPLYFVSIFIKIIIFHVFCTGLRLFVSQPVDIVPARTRDLAKQLGPNFEEIDNDTPGSQNE